MVVLVLRELCLTSKQIAIDISSRSIPLIILILILGNLDLVVYQYFMYKLSHVTGNSPSLINRRRRMTEKIISWSISTKVWDGARIKLTIPESAVRLTTDYGIGPYIYNCFLQLHLSGYCSPL